MDPSDVAVTALVPILVAAPVTAVPTAADPAAIPDATAGPTRGTAEMAVSVPPATALRPEAMSGNKNNIRSSISYSFIFCVHFSADMNTKEDTHAGYKRGSRADDVI